jgi:hypothetical protein
VGNELRITIPETFLSEAVYPVIVDPTIGTTTVGSQNLWDYEDVGEPPRPLMFEMTISVNRFLVSEPINGQCTAYIYTNEDDRDAGGRPVFYSDNGDKPQARKSRQEGLLDLRVISGKPKGWRNAIFSSNGSIASGSYIWFGVFSEYYWFPRFDYGAKCFRDDWWDYDMEDAIIPELYPFTYGYNFCNFKLSMYFTYTSSQNHIRTLTQGVSLADSQKLAGVYKRTTIQTVKGTTALSRLATFPRHCLMTAYNSMAIQSLPTLIRSVLEQVRASMGLYEGRGLSRKLSENVKADSTAYRSQGFYRKAHEVVRGNDGLSFPVVFLRSLPETATVSVTTGHWGTYVRGLWEATANRAETIHGGDYYRTQTETVQAHGSVFRGLLIFVKILTLSLVRDFVLRRFLKSNEELVLKSGICREIVIDSRV